jgi:hypothetical protein
MMTESFVKHANFVFRFFSFQTVSVISKGPFDQDHNRNEAKKNDELENTLE